jgi:hypothetical protein
MPVYRTLKSLSKGFNRVIPAGTVVNINWLDDEGLDRLVQVGAIAKVQAPPLHKFPGWVTRSKRLNKAGVNSVESFLEADDDWLAGKVGLKTPTIVRWKAELIDRYLTAPQKTRR